MTFGRAVLICTNVIRIVKTRKISNVNILILTNFFLNIFEHMYISATMTKSINNSMLHFLRMSVGSPQGLHLLNPSRIHPSLHTAHSGWLVFVPLLHVDVPSRPSSSTAGYNSSKQRSGNGHFIK